MHRRDFMSTLAAAPLAMADAPNYSRLVYPGKDGRLVYTPDERGNRIPDFSQCGYRGGGVALPDVPVRAELSPAAGDATERIQTALDKLSRQVPDTQGFRGALLLRKGKYEVADSVRIATSGVVLRGEGNGEGGTVLEGTGQKQRTLVEIRGSERGDTAVGVPILDEYVPVGARSFRVRDAGRFHSGDAVIVRREGNAAWIYTIAMDRIKPRGDGTTKQWQPFALDFERIVTAVEGDRLTVEAPITCAIETEWGGGSVLPFTDRRIRQAGVEDLRGVSAFDLSVTALYQKEKYLSDERHAWSFVSIDNAVDAWARRLTALHFGFACVDIRHARSVTVRESDCREMVSVLTGSRRYAFEIGGQLCLVERCQVDTARHSFVLGARVCGPNAFVYCEAGRSFATSEPHHRWSVGGLYDNVKAAIALQDRQYYGTGHGWSGANYVAWNCTGPLVCQKPPTAQNWSIGQVGEKQPGAFAPRPDGWWESHGRHVIPQSLYAAQLRDR